MAPAEKIFYFIFFFLCVGFEMCDSKERGVPCCSALAGNWPPSGKCYGELGGILWLSLPSALFSFVFFEE